ncbi:MAG: phosphomannomutase [Planctomycetes bacterium]|nr:phosphomannomutase [Planctomycetota bacterium]
MELKLQDLMISSGVKFGTSGARGLADDMTDFVCYVYTRGFLQYLESIAELKKGRTEVAIAGDLRPSTDRIMQAVRRAAADMGYTPVNCGKIPSSAVALYGIVNQIPAIMVTGSHIPADRNGIKFNKSSGEILKADEAVIREQLVKIDDSLFDDNKNFSSSLDKQWPLSNTAQSNYVRRYLDIFPEDCLKDKRIGVYQHSSVGRDIIMDIVKGLGADAVALERSDTFIPVDTEAIRPEDVELAAKWAGEEAYDTIISADGDCDRPLIADENGQWLRGDVAGILCAKYLGADSVSTPVSCNSAVEKSDYFKRVHRTRIGSPYVIESMINASNSRAKVVVGYEANGGFLTNSDIPLFGKSLQALPTRDAVILHLCIILLAVREGKKLSELTASLPERYTASNRLKNFPQEDSKHILELFHSDDEVKDQEKATDIFGKLCGICSDIDRTDGVRMTFDSDEVVHLRPSGNAPEFRCYNEAASMDRVVKLNSECMKILSNLKHNSNQTQ